ATAQAGNQAGSLFTDTDVDNHFGATPAINVVKRTNGSEHNTPPGLVIQVNTGINAVFTYFVSNPGNVPLSNVTLIDDNGTPGNPADDFTPMFLTGDSDHDGQLDPLETWQYTQTHTVTPGQYTNTATVAGTPPTGAGPPVSDSDVENVFGSNPVINL